MNNSGEVQTVIDAPQDMVQPVLKAMPIHGLPLDIPFEQLGLIPFEPDMWESWGD